MTRYSGKLLVLVAAAALVTACGGGGGHGGGGGGSVVPPPNTPPVASFTATPSTGTVPLPVQCDGSSSTDAGGSISTYGWAFGDGTAGTGATTSHVYEQAGTFTVTLTVTDNLGLTGSTTRNVTVSAPVAPSFIDATILAPKSGALVPDAVSVAVQVRSTYEVSGVTARIGDSETALSFDPRAYWGPAFVGTVSLVGKPTGPYTLDVRAADVRGNVDDASVNVKHDNPPALSITSPAEGAVALPTVRYDARCTDDQPGCTIKMFVGGYLRADAPAAVSGSLDLSSFAGKLGSKVDVVFRSYDSAGQLTQDGRSVYAENPARLTIVKEVAGEILDADEHRLLFVEHEQTNDVLMIYDRSTGSSEGIPLPENTVMNGKFAYLTPGGAIIETRPREQLNLGPGRLYHWRLGALTDLGLVELNTLAVSGSHAIWQDGLRLYRIHADSGSQALVSEYADMGSVAVDGTVVFISGSNQQVIRDRGGQQTTLTSDDVQKAWPLTDGENTLYATGLMYQQNDVVLLAGNTRVELVRRDASFTPPRSYQLRNGWAAYVDVGAQQQWHVFTRSPTGTITRHTDFAQSSYIDTLGDNGEVMIIHRDQYRYFSRGNGPVEVSSSYGESYRLSGAWYLAIGTAFMSVDTSP